MSQRFEPGLCSAVVLPTTIAIYGPECHQFFDIPENLRPFNEDCWPKLLLQWQFKASKVKAAQLHTEPVVDKDAVREALLLMKQDGELGDLATITLLAILRDCDCPPSGLRKKLAEAGFSAIMEKLPLEAPHPELVRSLAALDLFLKRTSYEKGAYFEPKD